MSLCRAYEELSTTVRYEFSKLPATAAKIWNALPGNVVSSSPFDSFWHLLKLFFTSDVSVASTLVDL